MALFNRLLGVALFVSLMSGHVVALAAQVDTKSAGQVQYQRYVSGYQGEWGQWAIADRKFTPISTDSYKVALTIRGSDESMGLGTACEPGGRVVTVTCQSEDFDVEVDRIDNGLINGQTAEGAYCGGYVTEKSRQKRGPNTPLENFSYGPITITLTCTK